MRRSITLLVCILAIALGPIAALSQVTYWFQGFERSGNAPIARAYLGVGGYMTNWFTTNAPGSTIPLYLLTNITFVQIDSNTWFLATNFIKYTNTTDLAGVVSAAGIGTNTSDKMPTNFYGPSTALAGVISGNTIGTNTSDKTQTNFYNNANAALLPGVVSGSSIGTNSTSFYQGGGDVVTNKRTAAFSMSNNIAINSSGGNPFIDFQGNSGTLLIQGSSYFGFGNSAEVYSFKDFVPQSDALYNLGRSSAAMRWKNLFLMNGLVIKSNSWTNASIAHLPTLTYGDNLYVSSNGVPHVIWVDDVGNFTTNRLVP